MRAFDAEVVDAVWTTIRALLPERLADSHPLGCHRPRIDDRVCFEGILIRLVTGCSWEDVEALLGGAVSDTTLRARRDEWVEAGVFDRLCEEAIAAYDRIIGLDLSDVAVDGSLHKAPMGGEGTGPNPTDRAKSGWKWSLAADRQGIPIGWAIEAANRNDSTLLEPTLDALAARGLVLDIGTLHLDKGYDSRTVRGLLARRGITEAVIPRQRRPGDPKPTGPPQPLRLGMRWPVERTSSWLSNFGQLRRNTDRRIIHRLAQFALAVTLLIAAKLIDWRDRCSLRTVPIG